MKAKRKSKPTPRSSKQMDEGTAAPPADAMVVPTALRRPKHAKPAHDLPPAPAKAASPNPRPAPRPAEITGEGRAEKVKPQRVGAKPAGSLAASPAALAQVSDPAEGAGHRHQPPKANSTKRAASSAPRPRTSSAPAESTVLTSGKARAARAGSSNVAGESGGARSLPDTGSPEQSGTEAATRVSATSIGKAEAAFVGNSRPEQRETAARSEATDFPPHQATEQAGTGSVDQEAPKPGQPDWDRLARNMGLFIQESGKAASAFLKPRETGEVSTSLGNDVSDLFKTLGQVAGHWMSDPSRVVQAQAAWSGQFIDLWSESLRRFSGGATQAPEPTEPIDKRFAAPEWRQNPVFDFMRQTYLMTTDWASTMVEEADTLDPKTREKARFYLRQVSSALSPSNFLATNPELLKETFDQSGENLVRGMRMLAEDIEAGKGELKIRQSDTSPFKLGVNMAVTPGKVVFRNELMELIQYAPSTPDVFRRPLLIVPPWINKFYVLDLNPEKSFVRWAVEQGLTVFVISWVNPDERHADKGFEAYMREGVFGALDAIEQATGERDVATIGYCVGGTLLAIGLAYMAARGEDRVSSSTFFTAQVDFRDAGDLKIFADEDQIQTLEAQMAEKGYLKGSKMANAFNMLRPNELIWSFVVNNYIKGKAPMAFDLLTWNSDSTRMPAANHAFYLRNCYLENKLTKGEMVIAGEKLDLGKVTIPVYNLATREDHIAPARSVFTGAKFFGGPTRYVLAGSGHIAGVVNPPAKAKYQYWADPPVEGSFEDWLKRATEHRGTWWPDWLSWLTAQAPDMVPARVPGTGKLPALCDAPGEYVRVQA